MLRVYRALLAVWGALFNLMPAFNTRATPDAPFCCTCRFDINERIPRRHEEIATLRLGD